MHESSIARRRAVLVLCALAVGGCPDVLPQRVGSADGRATGGQSGADAQAAAPRIACATPSLDFGAVTEGATVERTFVIRNQGRGVLRIDRAQGG